MKQIFNTIKQYHMIEPGMTIIAGVSGGADSVCLLYILKQYKQQVPFQLEVVHVEHGLRGSASMEDAAFTKNLCDSMEIPCEIVSVDVKAAAEQEGKTLEEAGRQIRYQIFRNRLGTRMGRIAVAHNQNDQAETVLWNLVRGSGLQGMCGMRPSRQDVIRPLLFTSRKRIETILKKAGLTWRTDATNLEQEYTRNRIRLSLLPQMENSLNVQAVEHIANTAGWLREAEEYVERQTEAALLRCTDWEQGSTNWQMRIWLDAFEKEDRLIQKELLKKMISQYTGELGLKDYGSVHLEALLKLCGVEGSGKRFGTGSLDLPGGLRAIREYDSLKLEKSGAETVDKAGDLEEIRILESGVYRVDQLLIKVDFVDAEQKDLAQIIEEKKYTKWISYDTIKCGVCLRHRRTGDYITINDAGGRKKLKDYMINEKIPKERRDKMWLLADGSRVLWLPGYRISADVRISPDTKKLMRVQVEEEQ